MMRIQLKGMRAGKHLMVIAVALLFSPAFLLGIELEQRLELTSAVTSGELSNGITYYIQRNENPRNVIDLQLVVGVGSAYETAYQRGLAHLIEHMGFNGTELYPGNQIVSELELLGAKFGPDLNAYTSLDETVYGLQLTGQDAQTLEQGLQILQQWGFAMELDRSELRRERAVVLEEERIRRSARQRIANQHFNALMAGTRYYDRLPIGRTEVVRGASVEAVQSFYQRWYHPERMALIVVGDADPQIVLAMIERIFVDPTVAEQIDLSSSLPQQNRRNRAIEDALREYKSHDEVQISIAYDPEVTREEAALYLKRSPGDNNTVGAYLESLEFALLGLILDQRFNDLVEEPESPLNSARLSFGFQLLNYALEATVLSFDFAEGRGLAAIELALREVAKIARFGVSEQEYQSAVRQLNRLYEQYLAEAPTRNSKFYGNAYIDHFLYEELLLDVDEEFALASELIGMIDPTRLSAYAQQLLSAGDRFLSYTGIARRDETGADDEGAAAGDDADGIAITTTQAQVTAEELIELLNAAEEWYTVSDQAQATQAEDDEAQVPKFIIDPQSLPAPQPYTSYGYDEQLELHTWEYPNGIRVIFRKNDYSEDTVDFNLYSRGGSSLYNDAEYFDAANAAGIVAISGVAELTPSQLRRYLADKQVVVAPYIRQFTEGMSGRFSLADRDTFGELLYAYFTAPRFDSVQAENWRRRTIEQIAERTNNPITQLALRQQELLTDGNPRTLPLTIPQAEGIDARNAYRIYGERFAASGAGGFTLVIVGNTTPEELQSEVLDRYISALPASPNAEAANEQWYRYPLTYPTRSIREDLYAGVSQRGIATMLYFGDYQWKLTDNSTLYALADYLDLLLIERIREENSSVYSVDAGASALRLPSDRFILQLFFGSSSVRISSIIEQIEQVIEQVRVKPPNDEELTRIKETQRSQFIRDSQTNDYWVDTVRFSDLYDFSIEEAVDRLVRIDALTADDIQQFAARYLSSEQLIILTLSPEDAAPSPSQ